MQDVFRDNLFPATFTTLASSRKPAIEESVKSTHFGLNSAQLVQSACLAKGVATFLLRGKKMMSSLNNRFLRLGLSKQAGFAVTVFFSILFCLTAGATQSVTVAWNAGTDPGIAGYALYYGTTNGNYSTRVDVGTNTSAAISGLVPGRTNYFAVAAYNAANLEGTPSASLPYIVPGCLVMNSASTLNLTFPVSPGHWYAVQATTNLTSTWTNIWQTSTESSNIWVSYQDPSIGSNPKHFYRLVMH